MKNRLNKDQKWGISLLIASKAFERLAFYSLVTVLIQYLTEFLTLEGNTLEVMYYYSTFYAVIGVATVLSGYLGDVIDRIKVVKTGFILMTIMYLAIVFMPNINVVILLLLIALGVGIGFITPNIVVFLGNIYNENGTQIKGLPGFLLFHITINIGAFIAPLLSIYLKNNFGYSSVFIFAFILVLLSYILFLQFKNHYNKLNINTQENPTVESESSKSLNKLILVPILVFAFFIWFVLGQKGAALAAVARDYLGEVFKLDQSLSIAGISISVITILVFVMALIHIKKLNWSSVFNVIIIGLLFPIFAFILLATIGSISQFMSGNINFAQYILIPIVISETLLLPVFTYSVYRCSPEKHKGLYQGVLYIILGIGGGSVAMGLVPYEAIGSLMFIILAMVLIIAVVLIMVLKKVVNKKLNEL